MRAEMIVENPGDVRVTLTITMTVNQWELEISALAESLNIHYSHDVAALKNAIKSATDNMKRGVTGESVILKES